MTMDKETLLKSIQIRPLVAPDLRNGFLETLEELSAVDLSESDDVGAIFRARLKQQIKTYVAIFEDKVIGTASVFYEIKFLHGGSKVAHVEDVAVHSKYQRHGVGRALLEVIDKEATLAGCYKIILDCSKDNKKFYQSLGYHKHEIEMRKDLK
jgi:glucosamine-phosphate N-acetyltransferase